MSTTIVNSSQFLFLMFKSLFTVNHQTAVVSNVLYFMDMILWYNVIFYIKFSWILNWVLDWWNTVNNGALHIASAMFKYLAVVERFYEPQTKTILIKYRLS